MRKKQQEVAEVAVESAEEPETPIVPDFPGVTETATEPLQLSQSLSGAKTALSALADSVGIKIAECETVFIEGKAAILALEAPAFNVAANQTRVAVVEEVAGKLEEKLKYLESATRFLKQIVE